MLFNVEPTQIERLNSKQLVELLRRLIYLEAKGAGIALADASVPLQITVADGGEDARVCWTGGVSRTNYLPRRTTFFQAKATDPSLSGWMKETWTKKTQKKTAKPKVLTPVLKSALRERAAYLGFTTAALVDSQIAQRIRSIRQGIESAGGDPDQLGTIGIYDANKIAAWAGLYPSIATWLHEQSAELSLDGFTTIENWGKSNPDFSTFPAVPENTARFSVGGQQEVGEGDETNLIEENQARQRVGIHLAGEGRCVRIVGPSGIGKSRFVFELLSSTETMAAHIQKSSAVYCDFRTVSSVLLAVVDSAEKAGATTTFVVDECPHDVAVKLSEIVRRSASKLAVLTIDTDDSSVARGDLLIAMRPSGKSLVENIIRQRLPRASDSDISYISSLSGGFPRIAVLACESYKDGALVLASVQDVVDRILKGARIQNDEQLRSIECLSLFERLRSDAASDQIDVVAESLGRMSGDAMYEHLIDSTRSHLVDRRGSYFVSQPRPIAVYLGRRRLERLRLSTVMTFLNSADRQAALSMFRQLRFLSGTASVSAIAKELLGPNGVLKTLTELDSEDGAQILDALVHVEPDAAMALLQRHLGSLDVDGLRKFVRGRRYAVWALEKLVFRKETFFDAARLLLKLAAADTEDVSNSATGQFKQLFQLHLSGTEVPPESRFSVVDKGIATGDEQILKICVEALGVALNRSHFSRSGTANEIGNFPRLKDWEPSTWGEIFEFHKRALLTLAEIRRARSEVSGLCEHLIADHIRELLQLAALFETVKAVTVEIAGEKGIWLEGMRGVGDWLYFDSEGASREYIDLVRDLYDDLMPRSLINKALLYTKFWSADIHNPDERYSDGVSDFEYSTKRSIEIADEIAEDDALLAAAIAEMVPEELNNVFPFAQAIGKRARDPFAALALAVEVLDAHERGSRQFIRGMLSGIEEAHASRLDEAISITLASKRMGQVDVYSAVAITPRYLQNVVEALRRGETTVGDAVVLSYGRGLDHLSVLDIEPLLVELSSNHKGAGVWAALEVIQMYQHGRPQLDADLAKIAKRLLANSLLIEDDNPNRRRDAYVFENMVEMLWRAGFVGEDFAADLIDQMLRACQGGSRDALFALDDVFRKILTRLVNAFSDVVWAKVSAFYSVASPIERHWLETITGAQKHSFDEALQNRSGALFGIPESRMFDWADVDPSARAQFLASFYPLMDETLRTWHPAINSLVARYGEHPSLLLAIARRMGPTSWMGSRVPHLMPYLHPLAEWFENEIPAVREWAHRQHALLQSEIERERDRDTEEELG